MIKYLILIALMFFGIYTKAQSPVGRWKKISHVNEFQSQKFDSHKALLSQRPCVAKIIYVLHSDGTYRLDAAQSGCDEKYINIQEKLYSESVWSVSGNVITIGNKKTPAVGQKYKFTVNAKNMVWTGLHGQGTITYQKM